MAVFTRDQVILGHRRKVVNLSRCARPFLISDYEVLIQFADRSARSSSFSGFKRPHWDILGNPKSSYKWGPSSNLTNLKVFQNIFTTVFTCEDYVSVVSELDSFDTIVTKVETMIDKQNEKISELESKYYKKDTFEIVNLNHVKLINKACGLI